MHAGVPAHVKGPSAGGGIQNSRHGRDQVSVLCPKMSCWPWSFLLLGLDSTKSKNMSQALSFCYTFAASIWRLRWMTMRRWTTTMRVENRGGGVTGWGLCTPLMIAVHIQTEPCQNWGG